MSNQNIISEKEIPKVKIIIQENSQEKIDQISEKEGSKENSGNILNENEENNLVTENISVSQKKKNIFMISKKQVQKVSNVTNNNDELSCCTNSMISSEKDDKIDKDFITIKNNLSTNNEKLFYIQYYNNVLFVEKNCDFMIKGINFVFNKNMSDIDINTSLTKHKSKKGIYDSLKQYYKIN